jgi:carboxypeptidase family protein
MKHAARLVFVTLASVLLAAGTAMAQSAVAGIVKDTTGSVMPGVIVEAASPALIERVRSAITDSQGQYTIVDLPPGTYTVTFTLPGSASVKRDGIELAPIPKTTTSWWTA